MRKLIIKFALDRNDDFRQTFESVPDYGPTCHSTPLDAFLYTWRLMLISLSMEDCYLFPVSRKTMSQPTERPRQFSLRLHQHRILFGGYHLFPTLKEGPRNIMASGSQLWSFQSSDLLTFMDFRHF